VRTTALTIISPTRVAAAILEAEYVRTAERGAETLLTPLVSAGRVTDLRDTGLRDTGL
jgi:hypothetical protein